MSMNGFPNMFNNIYCKLHPLDKFVISRAKSSYDFLLRMPRKRPVLLCSIILILRTLAFLYTQDVGIEHDSGWYIGSAQLVAEKGIVASYLNSVFTSSRSGPHPSIEGRMAVQDDEGYNYFPAGITVGPMHTLPQALLLRIFKTGYWQYKLWPLITYFLVIVCMLSLVSHMGGNISAILLFLLLWVRSQFFLNMSYESFSEHIGLLFLLVSIHVLFRDRLHAIHYVMAGILFAFSFMTKFIYLIALPAYIVLFISDYLKNMRTGKRRGYMGFWILFFLGICIPYLGYEAYKYVYMIQNFGMEGYRAIQKDAYLTMLIGGSGVDSKFHIAYLLQKMTVWKHLGIDFAAGMAVCVGLVIWAKHNLQKYAPLFITLCAVVFLNTFWFMVFAKNNWFRHHWFGLMIFCLILTTALPLLRTKASKSIGNLLIFAIASMSYVSILLYRPLISPFISKKVIQKEWQHWVDRRAIRASQGPAFSPIVSWSEQVEASNFVKKAIGTSGYIVYEDIFNATELSVLTRKVHFPLSRILVDNRMEPKNTYLIIGPYQKGFSSIMSSDYEQTLIKQYCDKKVFSNNSYTFCTLKPNLFTYKKSNL